MAADEETDIAQSELKKAREAAGLTLKDMFLRTRVSVVNLAAIENSDFQSLPVPIYTRNFIHTYARALGVDGGPTLKRYEDFLYSQKMKASAIETKKEEEKKLFRNRTERYKTSLWIAAIIIVFVAVALFVSLQYSPPEPAIQGNGQQTQGIASSPAGPLPEAEPSASDAPAQQTPGAPASPAAAPVPDQPLVKAQDEVSDPSSLIITASEETWVRMIADGQPPVEALLKPGEKMSRKAARFDLDIGNAGGVRLVFQGKVIENLGKSGQAIHLRLP